MPQVRAMYGGDRSRKDTLVNYGFRLDAARDNRPLTFSEFEALTHQTIYVSATPADYELERCEGVVTEQILRPTGLLDPKITVRPSLGQIDDLIHEIELRVENRERVLVTTLTKRMAEELTNYLAKINVKCAYMHSDVETMDRIQIIDDLRLGVIDVLVGVNLLREGLDLPEVSLVAILDADMQDPPSLIPDMIKSLDNDECDIVAARRVTRKGEPVIRSFFARMFYRIINRMIEVEIADGARDFRLMRRIVVDAILRVSEKQRFSKGIFAWVGFRTKWVEHVNVERVAGETKWSFWKLFKYAIDGIVAFTTAPLRLATIAGFSSAVAAFGYMIYYFIRAVILKIYNEVPGYPSLLCFILFIGGLILMALGMLGEYIGRTYIEVKARPIYIKAEDENTGRTTSQDN